MSYTAKGTYNDADVSKADKALIETYKDQWARNDELSREAKAAGNMEAYAEAELGKQRAHEGAEAVRSRYNYSGGEDGSEYIPNQSAAVTAAGSVVGAGGYGGGGSRQSYADEYYSLYSAQNDALERQLAEQKAAQEKAVEQAVNTLESRKTSTEAEYAELFRQLYVDRMRAQKNLDQRLAASGVTGGAAETTRLGYDTAYEDALRQGEQGRIGALGTLDQAIADTRLTGELSAAEAALEATKERTSAYADALRYLISRQDAFDARQEGYEYESAKRAEGYAREDALRAEENARRLLEEQRARELAAQRAAEEEEERRRAEEEQAKVPKLTSTQVLNAIKSGVRTQAVLDAYEYYFGAPYRG